VDLKASLHLEMIKGLFTHAIFGAIFVALSNATFVTCKCKLAAISLQFQCDICCNFPKIAAKFHQF